MAYIFEKDNFKNYLHKNCHRNWFNKCSDNVRYKKVGSSISNVSECSGNYSLRIREVLDEPDFEFRQGMGVTGAGAGAFATLGFAQFIGEGVAAFFTGGASLAPLLVGTLGTAAFGSATVASASLASNEVNVYFQIDDDGSEWVAKVHAENRRINELAYDIYKWSNEVYKERYEERWSSKYQYYIEHRPPTPSY